MEFTSEQLFSGWDGENFKVSPAIATDGQTMLMTWAVMGLEDSDVYDYEQYSVSRDNGQTFSEPQILTTMEEVKNGIRYSFMGLELCYSKKHKVFFELGIERQTVVGATSPLDQSRLLYVLHDKNTLNRTGEPKELEFPFTSPYPVEHGQAIEDKDGNFLITVYYSGTNGKYRIVPLKYSFDGNEFKLLETGTPIINDSLAGGYAEPSIAKLGDKYYMTIRSQENAYLAWSDDGLHFSEPILWTFDDGNVIGSIRTQQRWIFHKDIYGEYYLYLVYTRKNGSNDHVFRNRAPLYIAQVDVENKCLIKDTEQILVPELGAGLASMIGVSNYSNDESYVTVAETMHYNAAQYGADNSVWLVKVTTQIKFIFADRK